MFILLAIFHRFCLHHFAFQTWAQFFSTYYSSTPAIFSHASTKSLWPQCRPRSYTVFRGNTGYHISKYWANNSVIQIGSDADHKTVLTSSYLCPHLCKCTALFNPYLKVTTVFFHFPFNKKGTTPTPILSSESDSWLFLMRVLLSLLIDN